MLLVDVNATRATKANIITAANEKVEATLDVDGEVHTIVIQKNDEKNFDTSCNCHETARPI